MEEKLQDTDELHDIAKSLVANLKESVTNPADAIYVLMEAISQVHLAYRHRRNVSILELTAVFMSHLTKSVKQAEKDTANKIMGDTNDHQI
jgi:hypothetical protein